MTVDPHQHQPGFVPSWDPASLLNPKASGSTTQRSLSAQPARNSANGSSLNDNIAFEFSTPNDRAHSAVPFNPSESVQITGNDAASTDDTQRATPAENGPSKMLDRRFNLEDRTSLPVPKRRRLDTDEAEVKAKDRAAGGGGGILSAALKADKTESSQVATLSRSTTVDLTNGKSGF